MPALWLICKGQRWVAILWGKIPLRETSTTYVSWDYSPSHSKLGPNSAVFCSALHCYVSPLLPSLRIGSPTWPDPVQSVPLNFHQSTSDTTAYIYIFVESLHITRRASCTPTRHAVLLRRFRIQVYRTAVLFLFQPLLTLLSSGQRTAISRQFLQIRRVTQLELGAYISLLVPCCLACPPFGFRVLVNFILWTGVSENPPVPHGRGQIWIVVVRCTSVCSTDINLSVWTKSLSGSLWRPVHCFQCVWKFLVGEWSPTVHLPGLIQYFSDEKVYFSPFTRFKKCRIYGWPVYSREQSVVSI